MIRPNLALTFLLEAEDLQSEIQTAALSINARESSKEAINQILRAFHTIKGSGPMFGFDQAAAFSRHVEMLLDQVCEAGVPITEDLSELILAANDHIKLLLQPAPGQAWVDAKRETELLAEVHRMEEKVQAASRDLNAAAEITAAEQNSVTKEASVRISASPVEEIDRLGSRLHDDELSARYPVQP